MPNNLGAATCSTTPQWKGEDIIYLLLLGRRSHPCKGGYGCAQRKPTSLTAGTWTRDREQTHNTIAKITSYKKFTSANILRQNLIARGDHFSLFPVHFLKAYIVKLYIKRDRKKDTVRVNWSRKGISPSILFTQPFFWWTADLCRESKVALNFIPDVTRPVELSRSGSNYPRLSVHIGRYSLDNSTGGKGAAGEPTRA